MIFRVPPTATGRVVQAPITARAARQEHRTALPTSSHRLPMWCRSTKLRNLSYFFMIISFKSSNCTIQQVYREYSVIADIPFLLETTILNK